MSRLEAEIARRRTFAIISHPDAGKTTLTEKFLLLGGVIALAGAVKGRKASKHATSDWMAMERERGISITTSVMQFPFQGAILNLLDTPGHEDFSEDTYRTLTAVDCALMVIDAAKGIEPRTLQLMKVCRLRDTPIVTFINKFDRDAQDPLALLDEVALKMEIPAVPVTWPIGMGKTFKGIYHLEKDCAFLFDAKRRYVRQTPETISGIDHPRLKECAPEAIEECREQLGLLRGAGESYDHEAFLQGKLTPVYCGSALHQFGVSQVLEAIARLAPPPQPRQAEERKVLPNESAFSGFVFKIQANMEPKHRDRIAFVRVCSGQYRQGMKMYHVRLGRTLSSGHAVSLMAGEREHIEEAWPGDIIGIPNYGTFHIGDPVTEGEKLTFVGIPSFAPELFRSIRPQDPLKSKALQKGLRQLAEEGATQVFRPLEGNRVIVGVVGPLQWDVVAHRLQHEYGVPCHYVPVSIATARWITARDPKALSLFQESMHPHLALDGADYLTYLAPSHAHLGMMKEKWPEIAFREIREHSS